MIYSATQKFVRRYIGHYKAQLQQLGPNRVFPSNEMERDHKDLEGGEPTIHGLHLKRPRRTPIKIGLEPNLHSNWVLPEYRSRVLPLHQPAWHF